MFFDSGLNLALDSLPALYVGLFTSNLTIDTTIKTISAADFLTAATECTVYDSTTRPLFVRSAAAVGSADNVSTPIAFAFNNAATVYGAFLSTGETKASDGSAETIVCAVVFLTPRNVIAGDIITLTGSQLLQQLESLV